MKPLVSHNVAVTAARRFIKGIPASISGKRTLKKGSTEFTRHGAVYFYRSRNKQSHLIWLSSLFMLGLMATLALPFISARAFEANEGAAGKFNLARNTAGIQYIGPANIQQALLENSAQPLSLAAADFDEDGVPDLVSGYAQTPGGIVTIRRGNADAIYPNSPEAQQHKAEGNFTGSAFMSMANAFEVTAAPDFMGAGDFDGDSHWDLVTAAAGGNALYLLSGDGRGGIEKVSTITLSGSVTALITGEINRADGLTDVVVAIKGSGGPKVLVFEGPEGALKSHPETFTLTAEATSLALGQLDNDYPMDLAVAAGNDLIIIHGRDRKLSLDAIRQASVNKASTESREFTSSIRSIAIGDFGGSAQSDVALLFADGATEIVGPNLSTQQITTNITAMQEAGGSGSTGENILTRSIRAGYYQGTRRTVELKLEAVYEPASSQNIAIKQASVQKLSTWQSQSAAATGPSAKQLVRARVSGSATDDLLVIDPSSNHLRVLTSAGHGTNLKTSTYNLVSMMAAATPTVAALPLRLTADALSSVVTLNSGQTSASINLTNIAMTFAVTNNNDSGAGSLRQAIINANTNPGVDTINFNLPAGSRTITPLSPLPTITEAATIDGTTQPGFAGTPLIELRGTSAGTSSGLVITGGSSVVRGLIVNRFSNTGIAVRTNGSNIIEGNFVGTDNTGTLAAGNGTNGVGVTTSNNVIGGTTPSARNVISSNGASTPNSTGFPNVLIGSPGATGNSVMGNYLGTNAAGNASLSSLPANQVDGSSGVYIVGSPNNTVGGTAAGARNVISGNGGQGINLGSGNVDGISYGATTATGNLIQGNFFSTDANGTAVIGNHGSNVRPIGAPNNTVGGTTAAARNILSGSNVLGINVQPRVICDDANCTTSSVTSKSDGTLVQGNYLGTNVTGTGALGSAAGGVQVIAASNVTVGGATAGARNVISGNNGFGVFIGTGVVVTNPPTASNNQVQGNLIGTNASGTGKVGNAGDGVLLYEGATNNLIGGTTAATRNIISGSTFNGVTISNFTHTLPTSGNQVVGNFIGTDINGTLKIANDADGVSIDGAAGNIIGGSSTAPNVISGNSQDGISILDGSSNNQVQGNLIGTDASGTTPVGNGRDGVRINGGISNTVGSSDPNLRNVIANNGGAGVNIPTGAANAIINNVITNNAGGTIVAPPPGVSSLQFAEATASGPEGSDSLNVTVARTGDLSLPATVFYSTSDDAGLGSCNPAINPSNGKASSRCDYVYGVGRLDFAFGELTKTISIALVNDVHVEGNEVFKVNLTSAIPTPGTTVGSLRTIDVTILDNDTTLATTNPIDTTGFFVRQHYIDFLNREPDPPGLAGWTTQLNNCPQGNQTCDRLAVSSGFFLSQEFKERGYFIYRFYSVALGRKPSYAEFQFDRARLSGFQDQTQLEQSKQDFIADFMSRTEFGGYNGLTNDQYVLTLFNISGVTQITVGGVVRDLAAMQQLMAAGRTRAQVLRDFVESPEVDAKFFTEATVVMHYFGYLGRDPDALYQQLLSELRTTGNYRNLTNIFVNSAEYRFRFGPQ